VNPTYTTAQPTLEGIRSIYEGLTGKKMTPEEEADIVAQLAGDAPDQLADRMRAFAENGEYVELPDDLFGGSQ
jgi:hypothetical protein